MNLELVAFKYTPCEPKIFRINGLEANRDEWGRQCNNLQGKKSKDPQIARYGCEDSAFVLDIQDKDSLMKKYDINELEFKEVCDTLVKTFRVGECGWCI